MIPPADSPHPYQPPLEYRIIVASMRTSTIEEEAEMVSLLRSLCNAAYFQGKADGMDRSIEILAPNTRAVAEPAPVPASSLAGRVYAVARGIFGRADRGSHSPDV